MFNDTRRRGGGKLSNKSLKITLAPIEDNMELNRKIALATECFTMAKRSELILKDRTRLSEENALTVCNYIIAFKHEVNPRPSYIQYTIQFLSELSKIAVSRDTSCRPHELLALKIKILCLRV
jgi:hypothetical protein